METEEKKMAATSAGWADPMATSDTSQIYFTSLEKLSLAEVMVAKGKSSFRLFQTLVFSQRANTFSRFMVIFARAESSSVIDQNPFWLTWLISHKL